MSWAEIAEYITQLPTPIVGGHIICHPEVDHDVYEAVATFEGEQIAITDFSCN